MQAHLIPEGGGEPLVLGRDIVVLGRHSQCDIRLDDTSVSKLHCLFVLSEGMIWVRDLGSTNGTHVNGHRIRRAALLPNDLLEIGRIRFRVVLGPSEEKQPAVEAKDVPIAEADAEKAAEVPPSRDAIRFNLLPDNYEGADRGADN